MTKTKIDKELAGKRSTPYMSLKTHPPSEKHKSAKLLDNQIDSYQKLWAT